MGATVQILSAQLDAGRIVLERTIPIQPNDSWPGLRRRALSESVDMAREACLRLTDPDFRPRDLCPEELGPVYTLPNLRTWLRLQATLTRRRLEAARLH
jgi:methionyl-tRNA formyltransferase